MSTRPYFTWNDGVQTAYTSYTEIPHVDAPKRKAGQVIPLLSGDVFIAEQAKADNSTILPRQIKLSWEGLENTSPLLALIEATFVNGREVTVTVPWRTGHETITARITPDGHTETPRPGCLVELEVTLQEV